MTRTMIQIQTPAEIRFSLLKFPLSGGQQTGKSLPRADDIQQIFLPDSTHCHNHQNRIFQFGKNFVCFHRKHTFLTVFCLFSYQVSQIITQILCRTKTTDISAVIPSENRCCYNSFQQQKNRFPRISKIHHRNCMDQLFYRIQTGSKDSGIHRKNRIWITIFITLEYCFSSSDKVCLVSSLRLRK